MSVGMQMEIDLRQFRRDLRTLRNLEPAYRKTVPDRLKAAAEPMLAATKAAYPSTPPTSGWPTKSTSRFAWQPGNLRRRTVLKFKSSGFKANSNPNDVVLRLVAKGAAISVFDMARRSHRPNTQKWVATLNQRYGTPSRVIWKVAEQYLPRIQGDIARTMAEISRRADQAIARNR